MVCGFHAWALNADGQQDHAEKDYRADHEDHQANEGDLRSPADYDNPQPSGQVEAVVRLAFHRAVLS
jgi:hypothetical protein